MKKKMIAVILTLVLMLGVGGCQEQEAPEVTDPLEPTTGESGTPFEYTESSLENFHIAIAEEERLSEYDSFHEYTADEDSLKLIIWTDTKIKDFAFIAVGYVETGDEISLCAGDTLFSVDELLPEKPFVVEMTAPEVLPPYGISFMDENGVKRYFSINADGRGAEEASPYFLLEFENVESK